jgi:hypothetical protein
MEGLKQSEDGRQFTLTQTNKIGRGKGEQR